jgi:MoxR-like ATPase
MRTLAENSSPPHSPVLCTSPFFLAAIFSPFPFASLRVHSRLPKNVDSAFPPFSLRPPVQSFSSHWPVRTSHLFSPKTPAIPPFPPNPTWLSLQKKNFHPPFQKNVDSTRSLSLQKNNSGFSSSALCARSLSRPILTVERDVFVVNSPFRPPNVDSAIQASPKFQKKPVNPRKVTFPSPPIAPQRLGTFVVQPPLFYRFYSYTIFPYLNSPLLAGIFTANQGRRMSTGITAINEEVQRASAFVQPLFAELNKVIVGQRYLLERLVIGLLANGHVLLEGVPGLAKTLAVKSLAASLNVKFSRLQFTPDMLPADVIGTQIYNPQTGNFSTRRGPIFANLVLADEINRAPAKVQSALLEAMQEKQVTIGDQTFRLDEPFLVLATQNPIEQEGTYPLPEAQVDRFMLKLKIVYPARSEERQILDLMATTNAVPQVRPVLQAEEILAGRQVINDIYIDDKVKDYIVDVVCATRNPENYNIELKDLILLGASPRATIALTLSAKAYAFLRGRGYVTPQDVKSIGMDVLRHRVTVTYEAEAEEKTSEDVVQKIFDELPVP